MSEMVHTDRLIQYRAQGGLCWLCGEYLDLFQPTHTYGACSWEHVIPRCYGGSDRQTNLVLTHYECNKTRADRFIWKLERPIWDGLRLKKRKKREAIYLKRQFTQQVIPRLIKVLQASH